MPGTISLDEDGYLVHVCPNWRAHYAIRRFDAPGHPWFLRSTSGRYATDLAPIDFCPFCGLHLAGEVGD